MAILTIGCQQTEKPMLEKSTIVERVNFKVNPRFNIVQAKEAMKVMNDFVMRQPGYVGRVTSLSENDEFLDLVFWETLEDAKSASEKLMKEKDIVEAISVIDNESMQFGHFKIFNKN